MAGLEISEPMIRHLQGTQVLVHGGDHGSGAPSDEELATAPIVNHMPRTALSIPRAVRLYANGPTSMLNCDWTHAEWNDFEREMNQGLHSPATVDSLQRHRRTTYYTPEGAEEMNYGEDQM